MVAFALISGGALLACGGRGNTAPTMVTTSSATTSDQTAGVQPVIDGNDFSFPARGYAAVIPEGWQAHPGRVGAGAPDGIDTFVDPNIEDGVHSSITVVCEANPAHVSTDAFVKSRVATLQRLGAPDVEMLGEANIGGMTGQEFRYSVRRGASTVPNVEASVTTPQCGWTLTLSSAPSAIDQNQGRFDSFLKSFRLLNAPPAG